MKKILFITAIFMLNIIAGYSQLTLSFTKENPNPNFIQTHIPFLCIDFAPSNFNFFADFGVKAKFGRIYGDFDFRLNYLNGLEQATGDDDGDFKANSIYNYELPKSVRINLGYMIISKEVPTHVNFKLKSTGRVDYYAKTVNSQSFYLMADLGFRKGFNWVNCKGKELTFEGVDVPDEFTPPTPGNVRTMMDYTMLQVGISTGTIGYWEADIDGYGHRRAEQYKRYYLDMLILTNSSIDPINNKQEIGEPYGGNEVYTQYNLDSSPRSTVGFCLGATFGNISRFGLELGAETGYYPGIKGDFGSCFGFSINSGFSFGKVVN